MTINDGASFLLLAPARLPKDFGLRSSTSGSILQVLPFQKRNNSPLCFMGLMDLMSYLIGAQNLHSYFEAQGSHLNTFWDVLEICTNGTPALNQS